MNTQWRARGGFTLIEVLVALLVLAVGALGAGALVLQARRAAQQSVRLSAAVQLAAVAAENMRANVVASAAADADNPYLQWILTGRHTTALPHALRPENFEAIRDNLHRLEWHCLPLEEFLEQEGAAAIDRFNLSDIFEYMSEENYHRLLERLIRAGRSGGRLAYWNMLAPRSRPESMAAQLQPLEGEAQRLFQQDKAFFYSAFVLEQLV